MTIGRIDCVNHLEVDWSDMFDISSNRLNFSAKNGKIVLLRYMVNNLLKRRVIFSVIDVPFFNYKHTKGKENFIPNYVTQRVAPSITWLLFLKLSMLFLKRSILTFRLIRIVQHIYAHIHIYGHKPLFKIFKQKVTVACNWSLANTLSYVLANKSLDARCQTFYYYLLFS